MQDGVLLTWPHDGGDWRPWLDEVDEVYVALARAITVRERLLICVRDAAHRAHVERLLAQAGVARSRVTVHMVASNDSWARDHGPITVLEQEQPRLLDFVFNGWGGKYAADLDDRITAALVQAGAFGATAHEHIDFVLEGGAIESDGAGTLLTTSACLLSPGRNPRYSRSDIEQRLGECFGLQRVLWLDHGALEGDDTDSHIDTLARFCDPSTIAHVRCDDREDPHFGALEAMRHELEGLRDVHGVPYRLVALPWPAARYGSDGRRLPATYANFLVINGAVLVPTYRDAADAAALATIGACFPGREIIAIDCLALIRQYGSLHCVTMQLPAGTMAPL